MSKLEHEIQNEIMAYLVSNKIFAWRQNTGAISIKDRFIRFGLKGTSDILGIYKGIFLAIEVKTAQGKLRKEQVFFLRKIKDQGGIAIVARSLDDVKCVLNEI